jgi:hypothetical protein
MKKALLLCLLYGPMAALAQRQDTPAMDAVGATALYTLDPTLTGSGVNVAQIESAASPLQFEVNPGSPGQPETLFTWHSRAGLAGIFPNRAGTESGHSDVVAEALYGEYTGIAPGLRHVMNYDTDYFFPVIMVSEVGIPYAIFNQSFEFGDHNATQDLVYDDYIARYSTIVVSGVGDGGAILSPSDCYNGIGVAAQGGASSTGPTADGRCKPDITAPATETSFSTPLVSGAAALLVQEGRRLKVNATAAVDARTIKALLLTGAVKPNGWSHTQTAPLDPNTGAGVLNVYNSCEEMAGGRFGPVPERLSAPGHPPLVSGTAITADRGWDLRGIINLGNNVGISHYRITTGSNGALIATLVWNKGYGQSGINNLFLYAYDSSGNLLGSSTSTADNVQQLYLTGLGPGIYEIQVIKATNRGGTPGNVTAAEIYALAWDFGR